MGFGVVSCSHGLRRFGREYLQTALKAPGRFNFLAALNPHP